MKTLLIAIMALLLSFQTFAKTGKEVPSMTVLKFSQALKVPLRKQTPSFIKEMELKDFQVYRNLISFKLNQVFFQIRIVGTQKVALTVNGKAFSLDDLKSPQNIRRALTRNFKKVYQTSSLLHLFLPRAHAFNSLYMPFDPAPVARQQVFNSYFDPYFIQPQRPIQRFSSMGALNRSIKLSLTGFSSILDIVFGFMQNDRAMQTLLMPNDLDSIPRPSSLNANPSAPRVRF